LKNILKYLLSLILLTGLSVSCIDNGSENIESWKDEILETERSFATMAQQEGIPHAFLAFADENAVLLRNNKLIIGKHALDEFYEKQSDNQDVNLTWEPEFIDVSNSGDLAYTYGYYRFSYIDSTNNKVESEGVFHTIWKRQTDGSWKFVWD
jgi:ketosteroid isomerase-like protein